MKTNPKDAFPNTTLSMRSSASRIGEHTPSQKSVVKNNNNYNHYHYDNNNYHKNANNNNNHNLHSNNDNNVYLFTHN